MEVNEQKLKSDDAINKFKLREIGEEESFNISSLCNNVPFTQADFYGDWQKNIGRTVRRFLIQNNEETIAYFQLIKYPLPFHKSYLYAPYGPVVKSCSENFFASLKKELIAIAKEENAIFVRLDFTPIISDNELSKFFARAPSYTYKSANFQPRAEWFLSLDKTENELLMAMREKTRYSIRLAKKKGITAEIITENFEKYFDIFYELMSETAKRDNFNLHARKYYEGIFKNMSKTNSYLSIAKYGEKILTVNLIVIYDKIANYVFGGSSNEERNRVPSYLAHWEGICRAKQLNCDYYNFGAVSVKNETRAGWDGMTIFKKKFGGEEIKRSAFFDVIINPFWYRIYNLRKRVILNLRRF